MGGLANNISVKYKWNSADADNVKLAHKYFCGVLIYCLSR